MRRTTIIPWLLFGMSAGGARPALATLRIWPGSSDCPTTLQACIDGAVAGDQIMISTSDPIDESPTINKSLVLRNLPGVAPVFAADRTIVATDGAGATFDLTLEGLTFTRGRVAVGHATAATAAVTLRRLRLLDQPATSALSIISYPTASGGDLTFEISECEVQANGSLAEAILVYRDAGGGMVSGRIAWNRLRAPTGAAQTGIHVLNVSATDFTVEAFGNDVSGPGFRNGIRLTNNGGVAQMRAFVLSNVVAGQRDPSGFPAGIVVEAVDADVSASVLNNTVVYGDRGIRLGTVGGGTYTFSRVENNLVAFNTAAGLRIDAAQELAGNITNRSNLTFANVAEEFTPGPGTLTADPRLLGPHNPRLRSGSPAIDAGYEPTLTAVVDARGLPLVDADGLRRIKGAAGIDIGAFEKGDVHFVHRATGANTSGHVTTLDHPALNGQPLAPLHATANWNPGGGAGTYNNHPFGVYYAGGWRFFNEDFGALAVGAAFNAFVPAPGPELLVHAAAGGLPTTLIDHPTLNDRPDRILAVTQHWNPPPSAGVYNPHPVGVRFGISRWAVANLDNQPLPAGAAFNVYSQDPSPNAFRHLAADADLFGSFTLIDHPLLNGTACAQPLVTSDNRIPVNPRPVGVFYSPFFGRWGVFNQDLAALSTQAEFHVLVDPAQVADCLDLIFADGFAAGP
jgi:hypothetical protein